MNSGAKSNLANKEINMKSLILSTLISLTLTITPVWSASEKTSEKPSTAKERKVNKKPETVRAPSTVPLTGITPQAATATPIKNAEPALAATSVAATETAAVQPIPASTQVTIPKAITTTVTSQPNSQLNVPVAAPGIAAVVATSPKGPATVQVLPHPLPQRNPYLQPMLFGPVVTNQSQAVASPAFAVTPYGNLMPTMPAIVPNGTRSGVPTLNDIAMFTKGFVPAQLSAFLPGDDGASHLPISFKTVYPTGEKPLLVLTLKCPTEAAFGVAPPPVKLVHVILTTAFDGINYTGLLPVNLQQVCQ
jgi:hypothetical protein